VEKKISQTVEEVKREHPEARVEAWAEDEHRIGLKPINRIIWVQKGENPIASVNWKFEWLWLAGFVHPQSGETYWWIVPKLNWEVFGEILADFARHFDIGQQRRVVLALDQASFHTTENLDVPEGIHLLWMPPKSPELQPAERLWPLADEPLANRVFSGLDEVEEILCQRCRALIQRPDWIRGYTRYHWWPVDLI